jgi:hypothetical protein
LDVMPFRRKLYAIFLICSAVEKSPCESHESPHFGLTHIGQFS